MLLNEEQKKDLVNKIIVKAQSLLQVYGRDKLDTETGFTHRECHLTPFLVIEHQRQKLAGGTIKSNGLDLWMIIDGDAKKVLAVNYIPFEIKFFNKMGKAPWIDQFMSLQLGRGNQS